MSWSSSVMCGKHVAWNVYMCITEYFKLSKMAVHVLIVYGILLCGLYVSDSICTATYYYQTDRMDPGIISRLWGTNQCFVKMITTTCEGQFARLSLSSMVSNWLNFITPERSVNDRAWNRSCWWYLAHGATCDTLANFLNHHRPCVCETTGPTVS